MRLSGVDELMLIDGCMSGSGLSILSCCKRCYIMREKNQYLHSEHSGALSLECAMSTTREASITESIRTQFFRLLYSQPFFPHSLLTWLMKSKTAVFDKLLLVQRPFELVVGSSQRRPLLAFFEMNAQVPTDL
jgi:hypothetical protein